MHTLQWIAIKGTEPDEEYTIEQCIEDAFDTVRSNIEQYMGDEYSSASWYDWFVTGGGRWNPNENSQYKEDDHSMVISYASNPDEFLARVDMCVKARIREFNDYRETLEKHNIDINASLDNYTGNMDYSFDLYPLGKCIDMLQGEWDFNSYFYDIEHSSTNTKHMLDKLPTEGVNWYLVPVDFHF